MQAKGSGPNIFWVCILIIARSPMFQFFFFFCFLQLGANAILAVSLAVCKAGAIVKNIPLYKVCDDFSLIYNFIYCPSFLPYSCMD